MKERTTPKGRAQTPGGKLGRAGIPSLLGLLLAVALGLLVIVWRMPAGSGSSGTAAPGIERSSPDAPLQSLPRGGGVTNPGTETQRVSAAAARTDGAGSKAEQEQPVDWTLRFRIDRRSLRLPSSYLARASDAPNFYHAAIFLPSGASIELGRSAMEDGVEVSRSFRPPKDEPFAEGASFVLATCPQGVSHSPDVFFDGDHGRVGMKLVDARNIDRGARVIDLGVLTLQPVPLLGTLCVEPRDDSSSFSAFVSSKPLGSGLLGQFGRAVPGRLRSFSSSGGDVQAYSFGPGDRWSVLFKVRGGDLIAREEAARGEDLVIDYERPRGVSITVDLVRHADASRVILVSSDVPGAATLSAAAYDSRVETALATRAIPLPRFRSAGAPFTTVVTGLDDGRLRVELWGRNPATASSADAGGSDGWRLLHSQRTSVAGDVVEVAF